MKYLRNKEILSGAFLVILSVILLFSTESFNTSSISAYGNPATVPRIILALLAVISVMILISGILKVQKEGDTDESAKPDMNERLPFILTFILIAVYILSVSILGYIVSTTIYLFLQIFILSCFSKKRLVLNVIIAIGTSVIVFCIFRYGFDVFLPRGIFGF